METHDRVYFFVRCNRCECSTQHFRTTLKMTSKTHFDAHKKFNKLRYCNYIRIYSHRHWQCYRSSAKVRSCNCAKFTD